MTVLHLERHLIDPRFLEELEHALATLVDQMRGSSGVLWADATRSMHEPEVVTLLSEWRTEADLDAFIAGRAYERFCEGNDVRLREAPTVRRLVAGT